MEPPELMTNCLNVHRESHLERWFYIACLACLAIVALGRCAEGTDDGQGAGDSGAVTDGTLLSDIADYEVVTGDAGSKDASGPPPCQPVCGGKQCGPDGCGGVCGQCGPSQACNAASLCVSTEGKQLFGQACGATEDCAPTMTGEDGAEVTNPAWPACLDSQCASGACILPFCTRQCQLAKDAVDNVTGEPFSDGIEDEDAPNSCGDAADGPVGAAFRCLDVAPSVSPQAIPYCIPGTKFADCQSNGDCPDGEVCDAVLVAGERRLRCVGAVAEAAGLGDPCSLTPSLGGAPYCAAPFLCTNTGCSAFCAGDEDCITSGASCDEAKGTCANAPDKPCAGDADCSEWQCVTPHPDSPVTGAGLCEPKSCAVDADCETEGFHCRTHPSFFYVPPKWEHQCVADPPGANATLGDACTNDPADGVICDNPDLCYKGQCSAHCGSDADCDTTAGQVCATAEIPFDLSDDGHLDAVLPLDLCEPLPHAGDLQPCGKDADCATAGEVCVPYETKAPQNSQYTRQIQQVCRSVPESFGGYGEPCGLLAGQGECKVGFCVSDDVSHALPDLCTETCTTAADCPDAVTVAGADHPSVCRAVVYGWNGTVKSGDDLYASVCWPVGASSTLADCSVDLVCAGEDQTCVAWALASDPTVPGSVEYLCVSNRDQDGKPAAGGVGEPCEDSYDCASLLCLRDTGDQGYCSSPCMSDVDCLAGGPYMICDPHVAVDRQNDALDVITPQCRKALSCTPCTQHSDCVSGFVCANVGGLALSDYRCAPECTNDADCVGAGAGPKCKDSVNPTGSPDDIKACIPQSCQ